MELPRDGRLRWRDDDDGWTLTAAGDEIGRIRGPRLRVGDLEVTLAPSGERFALVSGRDRLLRIDPAGSKATTLTLTTRRYRVVRQRGLPGLRRWLVTRGVNERDVAKVTRTPLGVTIEVGDRDGLGDRDLALVLAGISVVVLDVETAQPVTV